MKKMRTAKKKKKRRRKRKKVMAKGTNLNDEFNFGKNIHFY